jgi:hypothetical protein
MVCYVKRKKKVYEKNEGYIRRTKDISERTRKT